MCSSVTTIQAMNYECKLDGIICQLEDSFATYAALQRTMADEASITVNPVTLIDKLKKMATALTNLKEEHRKLADERSRLDQQFGEEAGNFAERLTSTLDYLVAKK